MYIINNRMGINMTKNRFNKGLYKGIAAILISNNFLAISPITINAKELTDRDIELISSIDIDVNGDFEDTLKTNGADSKLWKDEIKPRNWDMSTHSTSKNDMLGEITNDSKSGEKAVKIDLDKSVGFLKTITTTSPEIIPGKKYELDAWMKTDNLVKYDCTNNNHSGVLIKAEQLDKTNKVINTTNIGSTSETTDWTNYNQVIEAVEGSTRLRLVVVFDSGLHAGVSGSVTVDNFTLKELVPNPEKILLSSENIKIGTNQSGKLNYSIDPIQASNEPVIWESSDPSIVEVNNGVFKGLKEGKATITAKLENFEDVKSECIIEVSNSISIEKVEFEKEIIDINKGKKHIVKTKTYPEYATEVYSLEVEDENIATIKDGIISSINSGKTNIIAKNSSNEEVGRVELEVLDYEEDQFDGLLNKLFNSLVPNDMLSLDDKGDMQAVKDIVNVSEGYWKTMNKDESKNYLWLDLDSTSNSNHITKSFERLREMAKAYQLKGSSLEGNPDLIKDIEYGLNWLMENRYNKDYYNNWWDWQIGAPQRLLDLLVLVEDYIDIDKMEKYIDIISYYVPNARDQWSVNPVPTKISVGANRLDMCQVVIYRSLFTKESGKIQEASVDILPELEYVTEGDGFYEDGSLIQHAALPYTGTYGGVLLAGIGKMNYILDGTEWAIPTEEVDMVYDVIEKSFEPLMHKGLMMDMVNGRSISRPNGQDINNGEYIMKSIVKHFIPAAPSDRVNELKSMIKYWIEENDSRNIIESTGDLEFRSMAKEIIDDKLIIPRGELIGSYNYANMDRMVHRRPGFVYGISTYSSRTFMHEGNMNKENLKAFHTSDGMTYLYNGDVEQYSKGFWPTVDPYRLPGTTVDTLRLRDGAGGQKVRGSQDWVGGSVIDDKYSAYGMYLDKSQEKKDYDMDLKAKKSWFMFDDEIVALGSDISSTKGRAIETIVENRRLSENGNEEFTVDNNIEVKNIGDFTTKEDISFAHIKGNKVNTDIGYYFPDGANINILRENRTGNWKDINGAQEDKIVENKFLTMWIDHGINPENEGYSYVLLPNKSKEDVALYNENPNIKILANTKDVQAVRENNLNITAANFWEDNQSVDFISVDKKSSIIVKEKDGKLKVAISDPTMNNNGTIRVELDKVIDNVIYKDNRVSVVENNEKLVLEVDVNNLKGSTVEAEFKLKESNKLKAPTNIRIDKKKGNNVTLSWDNPNDKKVVKYYEVYLDNKFLYKVNNEKTKLKLSNENHIVNLVSVDKNKNKSSKSEDFKVSK